ncbi:hypothetical protein TWF718_009469 [Orbilia javanica]|uniref:F-box domain-containing protein n=1 Tax=Orbilia javanica TaxID=47235 RepID=A0AAN8MZ98_9PEZI
MATLSLLPVELIYYITYFLDECEIVYFLRTSKHFYSILRRRVWSTLTFHEYWTNVRDYLATLATLTHEVGTDALGYRYIKKIEVLTPRISFRFSHSSKSGFLDLVLGLIDAGKIDLREVYIKGNGKFHWPRSRYTGHGIIEDAEKQFIFLHRLKEYSRSKSIQEFSMNIVTTDLFSLLEMDALSPRVITKLSVNMDLDKKPHYCPQNGMETWADEYLAILPKFLTDAVELRELRLITRADGGRVYDGSIYHPRLSEPLRDLQTALDSLTRLRVFKIGTDDSTKCLVYETTKCHHPIFFHPSFLAIPPRGCEVVEYCATVSVAWWRQFASQSFPGVEELKLNTLPMGLRKRGWMGEWNSLDLAQYDQFTTDEEAMNGPVQDWDFRLNSVAVNGLRKFTVDMEDPESRGYPRDLVDCIKSGNKCSVQILEPSSGQGV